MRFSRSARSSTVEFSNGMLVAMQRALDPLRATANASAAFAQSSKGTALDWHRLTIHDDPNPEDAIAALTDFVKREFEKAGSPPDFSVFRDVSQSGVPVFFFSPQASAAFPELPYFDAAPCPAPASPDALSRIV